MNYWILWEDSNNVRLSAKKTRIIQPHYLYKERSSGEITSAELLALKLLLNNILTTNNNTIILCIEE